MINKMSLKTGVTGIYLISALSTFGFAVLYSSLALFIHHQVPGMESSATSIVGFFIAANFLLHLFAGFIADKVSSNRSLLLVSLVFQVFGFYALEFTSETMIYIGLGCFLIGSGFGVTTLNCLLGNQFKSDDPAKQTAFILNYGAMNVGFALGFIVSALVEYTADYTGLFKWGNSVNIISAILMIIYWKKIGTIEDNLVSERKNILLSFVISACTCVGLYGLFQIASWANLLVLAVGIIACLGLYLISFSRRFDERQKIYAFLLLMVSAIIFWSIYFTGPMGLVYFWRYNVDTSVWGYTITPQWLMNINSAVVILGSPLLAWAISTMRKKNISMSVPKQFACSFFVVALATCLLMAGILFCNQQHLVALGWVVGFFVVQAIAELLISPLGVSMVTDLAPKSLSGFMMGLWAMNSGISATISKYWSDMMPLPSNQDIALSNHQYFTVFSYFCITSAVVGLILLKSSKILNVLMTGKELVVDDSEALQGGVV